MFAAINPLWHRPDFGAFTKGILTGSEYLEIDTMMAEKYGLSSCGYIETMTCYIRRTTVICHTTEVTKCQKNN